MDLHLHTPASTDYQQPGVSALDLLRKAEERGLDIIAFTDHNSVRGYAELWREIEDLELLEFLNRLTAAESERLAEFRRLLSKILLLPGFEFTATFGFHILAIFPETTSIRMMEHLLLLLGVPEDRFGSGEVGSTSDVLRVYEELDSHGAIVIGAHVNSSHGVAMQGIRFGGQTKIAYTQDEHLHALEVTDLGSNSRRSTAAFFSGIKAEYPRRMHCVQGSDAHRLDRDPVREVNLGIGDRATEVLLPEASFAALKALFQSDQFDRIRPMRAGGPAAEALHEARELGNSVNQVFHERPSQARTGNVAILRDVVALANGAGGTIYIGVGPADRRTVPGVPDAPAVVSGLRGEIQTQVTPRLEIGADTVNYDGKTVIALQVPDGGEKPYAMPPAAIFVRHGSETRVATRDEIVAMVRGVPRAATPDAKPLGTPDSLIDQPDESQQVRAAAARESRQQVPQSPNGVSEQVATTAAEQDDISVSTPQGMTEQSPLDPYAPRTGAEIVGVTEQDGMRAYSIRDLRNGLITHQVTKAGARRLWQYAIQQSEEHPVDEGHIRWRGDFGFWKVYRAARGERRFNLAYRGGGRLRVFFGVSEEGLDERWKAVLPAPRTPAAV